MVKQIITENVKVVLSENKKLISISFVALIQTIKADPQMVNIICNLPAANSGEQCKNNGIIKYLESNKDRIMDLGEKHYENLVEALTNNAIDNAAHASSSNRKITLPSLSSTFNLGPYNQNDIYRIKESEIYDSHNGDIAE